MLGVAGQPRVENALHLGLPRADVIERLERNPPDDDEERQISLLDAGKGREGR